MQPDKRLMPEALADVIKLARTKKIPAGQIIFYEGDLPKDVFMLKKGVVKLYDIDEQGNEKILHIVKPHAVIPLAFFSGMRSSLRWFYATITECELYVFQASELIEMTKKDGNLAAHLTNDFASDVHELLVRLSSMSKTSARAKILSTLRFLLVSHATEKKNNWWRVEFSINHQLIADICGVTRETTAITMKTLQKEHIIRNPRNSTLEINREKLFSHMSES